jgi:hypothetical protein
MGRDAGTMRPAPSPLRPSPIQEATMFSFRAGPRVLAGRRHPAEEVKMLAPLHWLRKHVRPSVILLLVLPSLGCGDDILRVPVEGVVLRNSQPLRGMTGAVIFLPDKARGNESLFRATGTIDPEGRYVLFTKGKPGAPPGHYKILVSAVPPGAEREESKLAVPSRYGVEQSTPLRMEVVSDPAPGRYDLKLAAR